MWNWNGNVSGDRDSIVNRILNVINIVLLEILLNNWLGNNFLPRNIDGLLSYNVIDLSGFSNGIELNSFIFSS